MPVQMCSLCSHCLMPTGRQERRFRRRPVFRGKNVRGSWPSYCQFAGVSNKCTSRLRLVLIALLIGLSPSPARAQTPDPQPPGPAPEPARPPLNLFPAEQKWGFLADSSKRTDFFDPVKYIPFGDNPQMVPLDGIRIPYQIRVLRQLDVWRGPSRPQWRRPGDASFRFPRFICSDG
jgi:hypothetical protein